MITHTHGYAYNYSQEDPSANLGIFALEVFDSKIQKKSFDGVRHGFSVFTQDKALYNLLSIYLYHMLGMLR